MWGMARVRRAALALARALLLVPPLYLLADSATSLRYVVRGSSMEPAFLEGHRLLVSRLAYLAGEPRRGDVVVARGPWRPGEDSLKRVVGLPGERVGWQEGRVAVDGAALSEPYAPGPAGSLGEPAVEWVLGPGQYLLLGDNRAMSTDGRQYGPVPRSALVGRAWHRYWPQEVRGRLHRRGF